MSISRSRRARDYWTPKNYDGGSRGTLTLRRALENSRNLATVHLLDGGIEKKPEASLDRVCSLAAEARIYRECERYYPFVLGAQPVRPIDLAAFYAAIANEGLRLTPHIVESIERNGATVYRHDPKSSVTIKSVDTAAFYQLKTMMQGVLARLAENDLKPWRKDVWCISQVDAEYVREGAPRQHRASFALCALMRQIRSFDILTKAQ